METTLLIVICVLLLIAIVLIIVFRNKSSNELPLLQNKVVELQTSLSKIETNLKEDFRINREENATIAKDNRKELNDTLIGFKGEQSETLKTIGINDSLSFLNSPKLQEKAFVTLLSKNKWELKDEIEKFSGKIVGGVKVTESGILAAAHLGGVGSVKRFLNSNGSLKCKDEYGTSVKTYMRDFGGYETTGIIAENDARVH